MWQTELFNQGKRFEIGHQYQRKAQQVYSDDATATSFGNVKLSCSTTGETNFDIILKHWLYYTVCITLF